MWTSTNATVAEPAQHSAKWMSSAWGIGSAFPAWIAGRNVPGTLYQYAPLFSKSQKGCRFERFDYGREAP